MSAVSRKSIQQLACSIGLATLSGCGWVDSTGTQVNELTVSNELRNAEPLTVIENTSVTAKLMGEGATLENWTWSLETKNEISRCTGINGFDIDHAVTSLSDACTTSSDCSLPITESSSMSGTQFVIKMPELKTPVAMSYRLSTTADDGTTVTREQLLCGVSINEAPQAFDDSYTVKRNHTLIVDAGDSDSLLSNDRDDTDFRNKQLQVVITPVEAPRYAALFNLDSYGGFVYQASPDAPLNGSGYTQDSFVYAVTDGIHTVSTEVIIKTFDENDKPERLQQVPDVVFIASNGLDDSHVRYLDLSQYFSDSDGDNLTFFSTDFDSTQGLSLSANGVLTADASLLDIGQWRVSLIASDGIEIAEGSFVVTVRVPEVIKLADENSEPTVTDIMNKRFTDVFGYDVSPFFTDLDSDDQLTYTARGLPSGVQIRADGVIEGTVNASNQGRSFVQVTATDGYGGSVTDGFNLILN
jgi:hypothetical protein